MNAEEFIEKLNLVPLPDEGGYFRQTWSTEAGTAIYFLITPESWSSFHLLDIAEIWHFYAGDPLKQVQLRADGTAGYYELSSNLSEGVGPQLICPGDVWQATRLVPGGEWALAGTTMAPPYTEECIRFPETDELEKLFPQHVELIKEFI